MRHNTQFYLRVGGVAAMVAWSGGISGLCVCVCVCVGGGVGEIGGVLETEKK